MKVTGEGSGPPALLVLQKAAALGEPFAVGLVDKSMEGMSGLEFGRHVTDDLGLRTPLVLMVGVGQDEVLEANSAFHALLAKPVHLDNLLSSVTTALECKVVEPGRLQSPQPPSTSRPPTRRVLLAEDNLINRKVALAMLEGSRYAVETVSDGEQAVEAPHSGTTTPF